MSPSYGTRKDEKLLISACREEPHAWPWAEQHLNAATRVSEKLKLK
jgi:hypothetical protein